MKSFVASFFKPTHLNKLPFGMVWEQTQDNGKVVWYIQVSEDTESPKWITIDQFFGECFKNKIESDKFIKMCLKLYQNPKRRMWFRLL